MDDTQPKVKQQPEGEENSSRKQNIFIITIFIFFITIITFTLITVITIIVIFIVTVIGPEWHHSPNRKSLPHFLSSDRDPGFVPLPDFTTPPSVHGGPCRAVEVAAEFWRVGERADDSVAGRAVGVGHQALVCALWCPDGAPHLQNQRGVPAVWVTSLHMTLLC